MPNSFMPPWWAKSPHIQTILPVLTKVAKPALTRQRLELPDGDFIDLDWQDVPQQGKPIVVHPWIRGQRGIPLCEAHTAKL